MRKKFEVYHSLNKDKKISVVDILINNHFTFFITRDNDKYNIVHERGLYILQGILKKDIEPAKEFFESIIKHQKDTIGLDGLNKKFTEAMRKNELIKIEN